MVPHKFILPPMHPSTSVVVASQSQHPSPSTASGVPVAPLSKAATHETSQDVAELEHSSSQAEPSSERSSLPTAPADCSFMMTTPRSGERYHQPHCHRRCRRYRRRWPADPAEPPSQTPFPPPPPRWIAWRVPVPSLYASLPSPSQARPEPDGRVMADAQLPPGRERSPLPGRRRG